MADSRNTDKEELDLFEARKAVASAHFSTVKTDAVVAHAKQASDGIRNIVTANGFLEKFRAMIQGSTP